MRPEWVQVWISIHEPLDVLLPIKEAGWALDEGRRGPGAHPRPDERAEGGGNRG